MVECAYNEGKRRVVVIVIQDLKSTTVGAAHAWLEDEWPAYRAKAPKQVYLDVRNLRVVDSTGMNWILLLLRACQEINVPLTIQVASPAAMRVFKFAGLDKLTILKYRYRKQL